MAAASSSNPFDLLVEIEQRSRQHAAPVPRQEEKGTLWSGVGFLLGDRRYVVPLNEVAEILPIPDLTKVPGVKAWLKGLANIRGTLLPVVDLPHFLGRSGFRPSKRSRVLVLNHSGVFSGVVVEEVLGLHHFREEHRISGAMQVDKSVQPYVRGGFNRQGDQWVVFSLFRLSQDPGFLQVAS